MFKVDKKAGKKKSAKVQQENEHEPQEFSQVSSCNESDDENVQIEVETPYPHKKREIYQLFKQKRKGPQRTYGKKQCELKIKEHLLDMDNYGYDFRFKNWHFKPGNGDKKFWAEMRRKVYVRFECSKCKQNGMNKRWTSILGVAEIKFKIQDFTKFVNRFKAFKTKGISPEQEANKMQFPKMVCWQLTIYREKCKRCNRWSNGYLYETQLKALCMNLCFIISQSLAGVKSKRRKKDDRYKLNQEVHKHEESLCQACKLGKCFNIPKALCIKSGNVVNSTMDESLNVSQ